MTTETITLGTGLLFVFISIIGGGITGKDTHIPVIRTPGRIALGFIGFLLCLPFVVGRIQWAGAVPPGTIVAWYSKSGPVPSGWVVCDGSWGTSQRPTPPLQGRFIRGTTNFATVGQLGGSEIHTHIVGGDGGNHPKSGDLIGNIDAEKVTAKDATNLPPYVDVIFIMKL